MRYNCVSINNNKIKATCVRTQGKPKAARTNSVVGHSEAFKKEKGFIHRIEMSLLLSRTLDFTFVDSYFDFVLDLNLKGGPDVSFAKT